MGFPLLHASLHTLRLCTTAKHTESNCPVALKDDRYTWRHNNVLRTLFPDLMGLVNTANRSTPKLPPPNHYHSFIRAGAKPHAPKSLRSMTNLLDLANDWILLVDDIQNCFPPVHWR